MVVKNATSEPLPIVEIEKVIPADGKMYILPEALARKYKFALTPIQLSDTPPNPDVIKLRQNAENANHEDENVEIVEVNKRPLEGKSIKKSD